MFSPYPITRKPGYRYRICATCDQTYNVSKLEKQVKQYLCPRCEWKSRPAQGKAPVRMAASPLPRKG